MQTEMDIKRIKLNKLSDDALAQRQLKELKGGKCCICTCAYANQGGSSTHDNQTANHQHGYTSKKLNPDDDCNFRVQC